MRLHLATKLEHLFTPAVRSRGESYYRQGAVQVISASAQRVTALVTDTTDEYETEVQWKDGELVISCDCSYFDSEGACRHLWAVVLDADRRGYLARVGAIRKVIQMGFYDDADDDAEDDDGPSSGFLFPLPRYLQKQPAKKPAAAKRPPPPPKPPPPPAWKLRIASVSHERPAAPREWPAKREIVYILDVASSTAAGYPVISFYTRDRKLNGTFARMNPLRMPRSEVGKLPIPLDREILAAILGGSESYSSYSGEYGQMPTSSRIRYPLSGMLLPLMIRTGRCFLRSTPGADDDALLAWDEGGPWRFELELTAAPKGQKSDAWVLTGVFRRGENERMPVSRPKLVTQGGHIFSDGKVAPLAEDTSFEWLLHLRRNGNIEAPEKDLDDLLSTLLSSPGMPHLNVPEQLGYEHASVSPSPCLRVRPSDSYGGRPKSAAARLDAEVLFDYDGRLMPALDKATGYYDSAKRRFARRDPAAEREALNVLAEAGVRFRPPNYYQPDPGWDLAASKLPGAVSALLKAGWHLEVDGKVFRRPGASQISVASGVDWFELHGQVEYGETSARIPELLEALRRGDNMVKLDDGTFGILPEEWLRRIGMLAGMGTPHNGHIRFRATQAGLLDALLAAQPEATFDAGFSRIREELRRFRAVESATQPAGFVGQLRDYQREGLGWMDFLRRFGFGGCLADDMGVGKTAQVLALLESRRELRERGELTAPSLVVVPRSLLFNWKREAERFTPRLRVLDHSGLKREAADFSKYDLILVTYGTLRRDAAHMKDSEFDYVVLDEAQAVKNASTESAKAVRLLRGAHRLALSGTPVENHIGELWSLFEFLNPGMLGAASVFKVTTARTVDEDTRKLLSAVLRPFILRRTKDQVARELPAKTEQTIYCELEPQQRKLYDELRRHYRDSLLHRIETEGLAKSKIMVLEALLRLRQAACHPGLIDAKRANEPSAKIESLQEQLREVRESGHKALVFSQFTGLLRIVRNRLDAEKVVYEYLDGKTRDRQAHVDRFQNDPDCGLFLISLKAGGLGLNLTAADYVFLLDPWWNPAVEAQAIDRTHRIGQTRSVFAYRLIARDTVEEKVLELQKTKRDLAAAIIGEDNALIRDLRPEDLELLLS